MASKSIDFSIFRHNVKSTETEEIATFSIGGRWFGLETMEVKSAIVAGNLASIPRAPEYILGTIFHHGESVLVVDLAPLLGLPSPPRQPNQPMQLVLLNTGMDEGMVGFLVDILGEIPIVTHDKIQPVKGMMEQTGMVRAVVKTPDNMLTLLDSQSMTEMIGIHHVTA
ncbi:MAG: hypothetical protein HC848_05010 [Limnobacter sp.]|nr:hypothetical protein [Limnobacter sp.]